MTRKLIMCKGLPGSGKSTWAVDQVFKGMGTVVRVNKDDIRRELETRGWTWSPEAEKEVIKERDRRIAIALQADCVVISDDTNLASKHKQQLWNLANHYGAEFEVNDSFLSVSVAECCIRDSKREGKARVGEKVIKDMAKKYLGWKEPEVVPETYVADVSKRRAIICDLDGTLALHVSRGPYETHRADEDAVNRPIADIVALYASSGVDILYTSGREDKYRRVTQKWLETNELPEGKLIMRATNDTRNDAIVKLELFNEHIRNNYNVLFVLDDRDRVVKMWRQMGLTCLQVAYGDF